MAPKFRVAVVGGGVAGLILALTLSRQADVDIDLYESAQRFAEVGAGIGLWPRSWKILESLGLFDDIAATNPEFQKTHLPTDVFRFKLGDQPGGVDFGVLTTPGGLLRLHRADFQSVLLRHLPQSSNLHVHLSKRLVSYTQPAARTQPIALVFQDGTRATCDILVGADGVRSAVRASMSRELASRAPDTDDIVSILGMAPAIFSGAVAYRSLIPTEKLKARDPAHPALTQSAQHLGKNGFVLHYPVSAGRFVNFVGFVYRPDEGGRPLEGGHVREGTHADLVREFGGWHGDILTMIDCADVSKRWAVEVCPRLSTFVSGRVALVGEAAHADVPFQGAGAGLGIEDAYLLGRILAEPSVTLDSVHEALLVYDSLRRPFAHEAGDKSNRAMRIFTLNDENYSDIAELASTTPDSSHLKSRLKILSRDLYDNWDWCWMTTLDRDIDKAIAAVN